MTKVKEVLDNQENRVLLVKSAEGEFKVTIPSDAKITFGPAIPYQSKDKGYTAGKSEYALRIYRGTKENLIAVFAGVYTFRDINIPVSKLIMREAGTTVWKSDEEGYQATTTVKKDEEWKGLDMLQLNSGEPE